MKHRRLFSGAGMRGILMVLILGLTSVAVQAGPIAIVRGSFYTPNLINNLTAAGKNVAEINNYTAASLTAFDAVIHYGNSFTDMAALEAYVTGGGRLIETPWFWLNNAPPPNLRVFTNGGGAQFSGLSTGVTINDPVNPLLDGVSIPLAPGAFTHGRTTGNGFAPGANAIATWGDGTAFLGEKSLGAGDIIGINMHVITSDTAFQIIDQPWATQLLVNAVMPVSEPATVALLILGMAGMGLRRRRAVAAA